MAYQRGEDYLSLRATDDQLRLRFKSSAQMSGMRIGFGKKYRGQSMSTAYADSSYVMWFLKHRQTNAGQDLFYRYVTLRKEELEGQEKTSVAASVHHEVQAETCDAVEDDSWERISCDDETSASVPMRLGKKDRSSTVCHILERVLQHVMAIQLHMDLIVQLVSCLSR